MTSLHYKLMWIAELVVWASTIGFALWRGDRTVRIAALVFLIGQAAMFAVEPLRPVTRGADAALEVVGLIVLVALAVRAPASWLLWICAFQLATVASYVSVALDPRIKTLAFVTATNTWWMLEMAALLWGAAGAHRARRRQAVASPA